MSICVVTRTITTKDDSHGDINALMRLRDWRPNGEVIAPLSVRQQLQEEANSCRIIIVVPCPRFSIVHLKMLIMCGFVIVS